MKWVHVTALVSMLALAGLAQANPRQRPSPPGTAQLTLGTTKIAIAYSRPKIRDPRTGAPRKIMGGLVPFGKVWRAGANEATALTTTGDLTIGNTKIPAGSYTLFAIPEFSRWTLIVSRKTGEWGIPYPGAQYDFARIPMTVESLDQTVDPFTISLVAPSPGQSATAPARLCMSWEKTRACAPLHPAP
ncbi:MAG: DUF2911 domain-containing protein [Terriglobales bacterium]